MIKNLIPILFISAILLFSIVSEVVGAFIMLDCAINGGENFMKGFTLFSLGTILFIAISITYILTKLTATVNLTASTLADLIDKSLDREALNATGGFKIPSNNLSDLFKNLSGGNFGPTTINVSSVDEDGNISPLISKTFDNPEEFLKHRDEILAKAFGAKPESIKTKIDEMTIEKLKLLEKEAVDSQDFELASAIRDCIKRKLNTKD